MKEKIYDEQIFPLMKQIMTICKEHRIAMLADFMLDDDLKCTSALLDKKYSPGDSQLKALEILRPSSNPIIITERITTNADGSKNIVIGHL